LGAGIEEGDWAYVESQKGVIEQKATITDEVHRKVINDQRHRRFPEEPAREPCLHGLLSTKADVLSVSDPKTMDAVTSG
jgi:anaerobic selenocysteine-containing dehydrogenase